MQSIPHHARVAMPAKRKAVLLQRLLRGAASSGKPQAGRRLNSLDESEQSLVDLGMVLAMPTEKQLLQWVCPTW